MSRRAPFKPNIEALEDRRVLAVVGRGRLSGVPLDAAPPALTAQLFVDSGRTGTDGITNQIGIQGTLNDTSGIALFRAGLDNAAIAAYANILIHRSASGTFLLSEATLDQLYGKPISDGQHTVHFLAYDKTGNISQLDLAFTRDRSAPMVPTLDLDSASDGVVRGDRATEFTAVRLVGVTEPGAMVRLVEANQATFADVSGNFDFSNVPLVLGSNTLTVVAQDAAGNLSSRLFTFTRTASIAAPPPTTRPDSLVVNPFFLQADIDRVYTSMASPSVLQAIFAGARDRIRAVLSDPAYLAINDYGLSLVFAGVLAYELKSPAKPLIAGKRIEEILDPSNYGKGIICDQYVALTAQIFQRLFPNAGRNGVQIVIFGLGRDSTVDNHATLAATGTGVPLLVDPTTALVAPLSLHDLLLHKKSNAIVTFSARTQRIDTDVSSFRVELANAIRNGSFDYRTLLYAFPALATGDTDPFGKSGPNWQYNDYVSKATWSLDGGVPSFWFITSITRQVWKIGPQGLSAGSVLKAADIVPVGDSMYLLEWNSGILHRLAGTQWVQARPEIIRQIAPATDNAGLYALTSAGATWLARDGTWIAVNGGGTKSIVGTGDGAYLLTTYGQLWFIDNTGWKLVSSSIDSIAAGYAGRRDIGPDPAYATSSANPGEIYVRTNFGSAYGTAQRGVGGVWTTVLDNVRSFVLGGRRITVNMLTSSGEIWQWDSTVLPDTRLWSQRLRKATAWSPAPFANAVFTSLSGTSPTWGDLYLVAYANAKAYYTLINTF